MRTVPAELADLIPLVAHEGVASIVNELEDRLNLSGESYIVWIGALSIWNARHIVEHARQLSELRSDFYGGD